MSCNKFIKDILKLILQNTNFIHNIRNLKFYSIYGTQCWIIENLILQIVHSHQNLKKILINNNYLSLFESLLSSNIYDCSNTLNTIIFHHVNFKEIINLDKIFEQLNVLESIHIFDCSSLNDSFTQQIINLTKPFKLKSLFIIHGDTGTEYSSIILQNLGQILPPKLKYLCLELYYIETSDFEVFLKNSQNTFIKKLLIHYYNDDQDILPSIKEYIMKKKRVEYLAIKKFYFASTCGEELFYLKDEVKRFGLYNIKVQNFNRLRIISYNYIIRTID
ncbi:unnamed protein product [Rhizophagus irregularis]|nr:unnamed protein product [Rhizophagus irregularis]